MDEKLRLYEMGRNVPKNAQKSFNNGRFSGTDINPMWRIKKLTEMFGPVGFGWYTEVTRQEVVPADDGNVMVFVDINLYVKDGDTWSKPIFGTGGNTLKAKGRGDDDGFKKAYTDAMSIACKALGIGADIWYSADVNADYSSKYAGMYTDGEKGPSKPPVNRARQEPTPAAKTADKGNTDDFTPATDDQKAYIKGCASDEDYAGYMEEFGADLERLSYRDAMWIKKELDNKAALEIPRCVSCNKIITGIALPDGSKMTAGELIEKSKATYNGIYCFECMKRLNKKRAGENGK